LELRWIGALPPGRTMILHAGYLFLFAWGSDVIDFSVTPLVYLPIFNPLLGGWELPLNTLSY